MLLLNCRKYLRMLGSARSQGSSQWMHLWGCTLKVQPVNLLLSTHRATGKQEQCKSYLWWLKYLFKTVKINGRHLHMQWGEPASGWWSSWCSRERDCRTWRATLWGRDHEQEAFHTQELSDPDSRGLCSTCRNLCHLRWFECGLFPSKLKSSLNSQCRSAGRWGLVGTGLWDWSACGWVKLFFNSEWDLTLVGLD